MKKRLQNQYQINWKKFPEIIDSYRNTVPQNGFFCFMKFFTETDRLYEYLNI